MKTFIYLGGEAFLGGGDGEQTFFEGEPFLGGVKVIIFPCSRRTGHTT
jgi:hypothetical protein